MTLGQLVSASRTLGSGARATVEAAGKASAPVLAVAHDSRAVSRGAVFVAVRGQRADGAAFAAQAFGRGAVAVVAETDPPAGLTGLWLRTTNARLALADLSALVYGQPSEHLILTCVTGTNGKTTSTYLLASVFDAAGLPCGRVGTVTVRTGPLASDERDAAHTT